MSRLLKRSYTRSKSSTSPTFSSALHGCGDCAMKAALPFLSVAEPLTNTRVFRLPLTNPESHLNAAIFVNETAYMVGSSMPEGSRTLVPNVSKKCERVRSRFLHSPAAGSSDRSAQCE
jgi:hypothetical protein